MKTAADYFQNKQFDLLREMDRFVNYIEYGVVHKAIEKFSRFIIVANPLKNREEKEVFVQKSDSHLEYLKEMSKKSGAQYRKQIAEDFLDALNSIFADVTPNGDVKKLFSIEKSRREKIKKFCTVEDCFVFSIAINMPNFYAVNRTRDYNLDSFNLFGEKFTNLAEVILNKKVSELDRDNLTKQHTLLTVDSFDDRKALAKAELILEDIMDRRNEIKLAMAEMYNRLYIAQSQDAQSYFVATA